MNSENSRVTNFAAKAFENILRKKPKHIEGNNKSQTASDEEFRIYILYYGENNFTAELLQYNKTLLFADSSKTQEEAYLKLLSKHKEKK